MTRLIERWKEATTEVGGVNAAAELVALFHQQAANQVLIQFQGNVAGRLGSLLPQLPGNADLRRRVARAANEALTGVALPGEDRRRPLPPAQWAGRVADNPATFAALLLGAQPYSDSEATEGYPWRDQVPLLLNATGLAPETLARMRAASAGENPELLPSIDPDGFARAVPDRGGRFRGQGRVRGQANDGHGYARTLMADGPLER